MRSAEIPKTETLKRVIARPIAHRGLHDRARGIIENTAEAFAAALAGGFGMECDIQASLDGEAMVFHDHTLDRLTLGNGPIITQTATTLTSLAFRDSSTHMGTLDDLLRQVAGREALVVEVKSRFDGDTAITRRIAECVRDYAGPLVLKSFDPAMIIALRDAGVRQPLGIVAMADYVGGEFAHLSSDEQRSLANLLHFAETRPDFLSWRHADLPSAAPYLCRTQLGLPVMSWTIRSPLDAARAAPHIDQMVFEGFLPA